MRHKSGSISQLVVTVLVLNQVPPGVGENSLNGGVFNSKYVNVVSYLVSRCLFLYLHNRKQ